MSLSPSLSSNFTAVSVHSLLGCLNVVCVLFQPIPIEYQIIISFKKNYLEQCVCVRTIGVFFIHDTPGMPTVKRICVLIKYHWIQNLDFKYMLNLILNSNIFFYKRIYLQNKITKLLKMIKWTNSSPLGADSGAQLRTLISYTILRYNRKKKVVEKKMWPKIWRLSVCLRLNKKRGENVCVFEILIKDV